MMTTESTSAMGRQCAVNSLPNERLLLSDDRFSAWAEMPVELQEGALRRARRPYGTDPTGPEQMLLGPVGCRVYPFVAASRFLQKRGYNHASVIFRDWAEEYAGCPTDDEVEAAEDALQRAAMEAGTARFWKLLG